MNELMYKLANDIPQTRRWELSALMNQRLASAVDLQRQVKQARWSVKGPSLIALHELLGQVAQAVESYADMIAERILQLGSVAEGTARIDASRSRPEEYPLAMVEGVPHVAAVAGALFAFKGEARSTVHEANELGDAYTADLFSEILRGTDKWLWFVEAYSQAGRETAGCHGRLT